MFFSFKNLLSRRLTNTEMHEVEVKAKSAGAFVGASLIDKKPLFLDPACGLIRISGNHDTFAGDVAIKLIRHAVDNRKSVLMLDFQTIEEFWHKFWAMAFYLDRSKEFRLLDFSHQERSDFMVNDPLLKTDLLPKHLFGDVEAFSPKSHLDQQGLLALSMFGSLESDCEPVRKGICALAEQLIPQADALVVYGWDQLDEAQQRGLLNARTKQGAMIPTTLVQFSFPATGTHLLADCAADLLFRQRNNLPEALWSAFQATPAPKSIQKVRPELTSKLNELDDMVGFVWKKEGLDLMQIPSGEGLPWPPEYRPLRARL